METNLNIDQEVILVNEQNEAIGKMEKMEAHRKAQLHRAFSVFIFNSKGEMLLHQRALNKYHCGGLWTNACCSHPSPGRSGVRRQPLLGARKVDGRRDQELQEGDQGRGRRGKEVVGVNDRRSLE